MSEPKPHAFYATRKGTPVGVPGDWWRRCDHCGQHPDADIHNVSNVENGKALLRALEPGKGGHADEGGDR